MKRMIAIALALVAAYAADAVTEEEYQAAREVIKAYKAEHRTVEPVARKSQAELLGVDATTIARAKYRAEVIKHTERKGSGGTITGREAKASMRDRIEKVKETAKAEAERADLNEHDAKKARELEKAAKKSAKAREKIIKTIEQAIKKSSDEDEIAFYESLLEMIEGDQS